MYFVDCQSISTVPDTDGGDAYVTSSEGQTNVSVVCTVLNSLMIQAKTDWRIRREGEDQDLIDLVFDENGQPVSPGFIVGDIFITGQPIPMFNDIYATNLTFLNFTSEYDTTQLQCGPTNSETRSFFLGFPGLMQGSPCILCIMNLLS